MGFNNNPKKNLVAAPNQELDKFKSLDNLLRSEGPYFLTIVVDIHTVKPPRSDRIGDGMFGPC